MLPSSLPASSFAADLHIHSRYAFACSRSLTLNTLSSWAARKGIDLLATGDFTHPRWAEELRANLRPDQDGLYEYQGTRYTPGTEISCVYRQDGRVRRIHLLVFMPTLDAAGDLTGKLSEYGNLSNDGRPTVSTSARELLALALDCHPEAIVIPAHAWTPWYGVYGSRSGFDSLEECFGDLAPQITAVESGLSSDPAMNRHVPELKNRAVVSFSDAHSAPRLGRELTVFSGQMSWESLVSGVTQSRVAFTVEFYPEEGKYHYSGHRKCGVSYDVDGEAEHGTLCPVCGRPLTLGVLHRVAQLSASRLAPAAAPGADGFIRSEERYPPFARLIPLQEIIAATRGVGVGTRTVAREYNALTDAMGSELAILLHASADDLLPVAGEDLTQAIMRARGGRVAIEPGYDGKYGVINLDGDGRGGR